MGLFHEEREVFSCNRERCERGGGCGYKPVELEGVGAVAVSCLTAQVGRQVDDINSIERAFLQPPNVNYTITM